MPCSTCLHLLLARITPASRHLCLLALHSPALPQSKQGAGALITMIMSIRRHIAGFDQKLYLHLLPLHV